MSLDKMSTDEKIKKPLTKVEVTPQPYFIPGYTGHCPGLRQVIGISYGRATNEILKNRPEVANVLSPLDPEVAHPEKIHERTLAQMEKDKRLINSRFTEGRKLFTDSMMPGYSGHVPNISESIGMSYNKRYVKSIAQFIRQKEETEEEMVPIM